MRLKVSKSKNSASLYVIKSTYENNKHSSKIVEKLGTEKELREKLEGEDPYEWAKKYIENLNKEEKESRRKVKLEFSPNKIIEADKKVTYNGGYLFLKSLYYELGLEKICDIIKKKYRFTFDINKVLEYLIYGRIMYPSSKLATKKQAKKYIESPDLEIQHIYRGLEIFAKENDFIQAELYKKSAAITNRNTNVLFYDCTNFFFEIEQESGIKQYGRSKENRPNPIVEMGLFMDGDGLPLAFCIHPGNTNEQVTLKPLEEKILSDFELSKFIVSTDAGLSSIANRKFNNISGRAFITTQSVKKLKKFLKEWALSPEGWRLDGKSKNSKLQALEKKGLYDLAEIEKIYNSEAFSGEERNYVEALVFYKERWIKEDDLEQRLIVTFSLKYKNYQNNIRIQQIERAQKTIDKNPSKLKRSNASDYRRLVKKTYCTSEGEVAEKEKLAIDLDIIAEEARYDGFYAVCTNLEDKISCIVKVNKGRWEIEESFRIMKSEFKARPVFLSRDDRIKAHFMTCFLSLFIYRLLEKRLENRFTYQKILEGLREMNFYRVAGEGFIPIYPRNSFTDALHEKFGFRTDYEIVNFKEIKKIFKLIKK